MTNRCPHPSCERLKPFEMYACKAHWFSLPKPIRDDIWSAYRKHGALSTEWLAADQAAADFWKSSPTYTQGGEG